MNRFSVVGVVGCGLVLLLSWVGVAFASSNASAAQAASSPTTFAKSYSNFVGGTEFAVYPEDTQTTSDGGSIALGITQSSTSIAGVSWLVKLSSSGRAQWQREVGCLNTGTYADGASIAQTADGGYVVGGGTIGCGSGSTCPYTSGIACALIEKISSTGAIVWARVYSAGATGSAIEKVRATSDGGLIAAGTINDVSGNIGGLILKLDGQGNVQWQRQLGPAGSSEVLFNDVQQTSDGGYVATGQLDTHAADGLPVGSVLVVKLDSSGDVVWQRTYNSFGSAGAATNYAQSIIQTSDGGYLVGGNWDDAPTPTQCCSGALLLKLDPSGDIQWQTALSGGLYCYDNGYSETCANLTATAYSLHQTADGGYVLAGDETLKLLDETPIEPWIAKVNTTGSLVWQHLYYQTNKSTGRPLSEWFPASAAAGDGGLFSLGYTENATNGDGELFAVKTDSSGLAGATCIDLHPATTLNPVNPSLTATVASLPVSSTLTPSGDSPATTKATSIRSQADC